jgi:hypothetical protein
MQVLHPYLGAEKKLRTAEVSRRRASRASAAEDGYWLSHYRIGRNKPRKYAAHM